MTVFNPTPGGGTFNAVTFTINNPVPSITYVYPPSIRPGITTYPVGFYIDGSGFVATSVVRWNGADRPTSVISRTFVSANIPASDFANPGTAQVTVFNPAPGGGTSNAWTVFIEDGNPVPILNNLNPSRATAGDPAFTLQAIGGNFVADSVVRWNGQDRATTFVNSQLRAAISASDVASVGSAEISVFTPRPGGGPSRSRTFTIEATNPVPLLYGLLPFQHLAGGGGFTVEVQGGTFVLSSVVRWNGEDRPTTFIDDNRLHVSIPASDIANPGTAEVTVFTPAPGGGTSNALTFAIPEFKVATSRLPDTSGGKKYEFWLAVSIGDTTVFFVGGFTWSVVAGTLPPDLLLDSSRGGISGTVVPVVADTLFSFTVRATDDNQGVSATRDLSILVRAADLTRNDTCTPGSTAGTTVISNGKLPASLSPYGDVDVYSFQGTVGAKVTIETLGERLGGARRVIFTDTVVELLDASCNLLTFNDDIEPGLLDSRIRDFTLPSTGTYFIRVRDFRGDGRPDLVYKLLLTGAN
ncbi:MAG: PPC domain-containing protein [Terriglobia bacterium]